MNIQILMLEQDDPKKCTAAKLVKFGLARNIPRTRHDTIVLDPFAKQFLLSQDSLIAKSITAIDCSWNFAQETFTKRFAGLARKLPPLLAGNPVNYSKLNKLTTVEAISGALFILNHADLAMSLLGKFTWGHTFYDLNRYLIEDYLKIRSEEEIEPLLREYGLVKNID